MYIVQIASELAPVAKVGGLSDVLLGLSRQLVQLGHQVEIIIPRYDCIDYQQVGNLQKDPQEVPFIFAGMACSVAVWRGPVQGLDVTFLQPIHAAGFFERGCFYACCDDVDRFACFASAALEYLAATQKSRSIEYDVFHIHDWQAALIAPLYHLKYASLGLNVGSVVFTIHNLEYQGHCTAELLNKIDLQMPQSLELAAQLQDLYYPHTFNLLKGGIIYADYVTTVSPTYALECQTAEGGKGLDPLLKKYQNKFRGIINGIDYTYWNPEADSYLPTHYHGRDAAGFENKYVMQFLLRKKLELNQSNQKPMVGCITRLVPQKGVELIRRAIDRTIELGGQFVLLGSSPIPAIHNSFEELKAQLSSNRNVHFELNYNEELSHWIYAACDLFIVPSLFEPCGLTQMIALRYGTVPIVRKTGGLADTVFDVEYSNRPFEETNGFVFEFPDVIGMDWALDRAFDFFCNKQQAWKQLVLQGMNQDLSWQLSAQEYLEVYQESKLVHIAQTAKSPRS